MASPNDALVASISSWLRSRRTDVATRLASHQLPLAVVENAQVAEHLPTGGMAGNVEPRTVSAFQYVSLQYPSLAGAIGPLIAAAGVLLAASLVEVFGPRLRYLARTGPRGLEQDLEHPALVAAVLDDTQPVTNPVTSMLSFKPIFYALMLLRQCLVEYLTSITSLGVDDSASSDRLARELVDVCASTDVVHVARVPLAGLDVASGSVTVRELTIRRLSREELGYLFWRRDPVFFTSRTARSMPGVWRLEEMLMERVALEVRERRPKTEFYTPAVACQRILLALHLLGFKIAGSGFGAMLEEPLWVDGGIGQSAYPVLMPRAHVEGAVDISAADALAVANLSDRIPPSALTAPSSPQDLTISRLAFAMWRTDPREALVDYTIALEGLLLAGTDVTEARRRFALNGAVFIGSTPAERRALYKQLHEIYGARSVLVHGVNPADPRAKKVQENIIVLRDQASTIASIGAVKALNTGWPTDRDFIEALLDEPTNPHLN